MQESPRGRVNPTFRTVSRECSVQSTPPAMSPPYLGPSLVTVTLFKGVFFKPEDFETGFASPNQPQQVAQDQANGTSPLSSTDTLMDSNRFPSSTVTPLSQPSTSTHHNHQEVISNYKSQPSANGLTGKRKHCEIENEVEEDDEDDCDEWIDCDHENEHLFPPVKKPRMDTTRPDSAQPMVVRQSVLPAEDEQQKQVIKQDRQVVTIALQCPEWNCSQMFTTNVHNTAVDQLNHHLKVVHSIGLHRCMVLYCAESFPNSHALGRHLKNFHPGIVKWHCSKCPKHFTSYKSLSKHKMLQHQLGKFECSFSACTFTAEYKEKVVYHYGNHHRVKPELVCQAKSGCTYRTTNPCYHKEHERVHLGIKPFRCDWPNCGHSSSRRGDTIRHIEKIHFSTKTISSDKVGLAGKAMDYLLVDHSLL